MNVAEEDGKRKGKKKGEEAVTYTIESKEDAPEGYADSDEEKQKGAASGRKAGSDAKLAVDLTTPLGAEDVLPDLQRRYWEHKAQEKDKDEKKAGEKKHSHHKHEDGAHKHHHHKKGEKDDEGADKKEPATKEHKSHKKSELSLM